jgi:hypothetical protein
MGTKKLMDPDGSFRANTPLSERVTHGLERSAKLESISDAASPAAIPAI